MKALPPTTVQGEPTKLTGDPLNNLPRRIAHNPTAHHRAAHNLGGVRLGCVKFSQTAMYFGPTLAHRRYYRPDVGPTLAQPTSLSDWLGCEKGLPIRVTHTTEPAHHRAAGLCAVP